MCSSKWYCNGNRFTILVTFETHLSASSLKLSMPIGCRLSARVFFLISLPVIRLPLRDSAWERTDTVHSNPLYHCLHLYISVTAKMIMIVWPWPGSLQSLFPCQKALSSSWLHHQPSSWLLLLLFCDAPPDKWRRRGKGDFIICCILD